MLKSLPMKKALVFPGQGAQSVGMGKDSYNSCTKIKEVYETVDRIFAEFHKSAQLSPDKISTVSFTGPEEALTRTVYTQPAILALSIALAVEVKNLIKSGKMDAPLYVAGHSLGEFSALFMADVLSLEDVIKLVIKRADLMEKAPPGAMTAIVGMEEEVLRSIIDQTDDAEVANYNAPDQIVATGTKPGMEKLAEAVESFAEKNQLKVRVIALNVGGAFHSSLMKEASEEFSSLIDSCEFKDAKIPVIQNISAEPVTKAESLKANLKLQMTGSVEWTKTVSRLIKEVEEIVEIGPGKVLAGLVKKQDRRFPVKNVNSTADISSLKDEAKV
jgi:[acyl-carrier-protein] S-malonyltransferase